jgi:phage terminase large subunit-like protein
LISARPGSKSVAGWLASKPSGLRDKILDGLSPNALAALPFLFEMWGRARYQLPPQGDWSTWVVLGGRGSGKTRTGAEWVRAQVEGDTPLAPGLMRRFALVAETWEQAREVMVFGESGLVACSPPDRAPSFVATRRKLIWANGAEAQLFSALDPESLRGPQFDGAWCDELAKWRRADAAWDMLQFGLRLGTHPRQIVTTTPRDMPLLHRLLADPGTAVSRSTTAENRANLAEDFIETITRQYAGTVIGRQELGGEMVTDPAGSLFPRAAIDAARVMRPPALDRVVVAVDPPVGHGVDADECGIVVAGRSGEAFYVLADRSLARATPQRWASAVVEAWQAHGANRIVAEVNQGGDMVVEILRQIAPHAPVASVRATRSKTVRAEPVALLYERGLVRHVGHFAVLEDQLVTMGQASRSPDRADALVWAITELQQDYGTGPRVRTL